MKIKKTLLILSMLLIIPLLLTGCGTIGEEEEHLEEPGEEIPEEIEEMESLSVETMQEADMIVLLEEEPGENEEADEGENEAEEGEKAENGENNQDEEITFEKTILGEVLRREMEEGENTGENEGGNEEAAEDEEEAWDNIKLNVTEIHEQWSELETQLKDEDIPEEQISSFEDTLEELITQATAQERFATIVFSNKLTSHLAEFMVPFAEGPVPEVIKLKFYVRKVVVNAVADEYEEAAESVDYISEHKLKVIDYLEENQEEEKAEQLESSVEDLQESLEQKEENLVKLSAALVMDDLVEILEELKEEDEEENDEEENDEEEEEENRDFI